MSERMQALLSRAAEDQVSEQRQIQAMLTELRTVLGRLPADLAAAAASAQPPDQNVGAYLGQLGQQVAQLGQRLDMIAQSVASRPQDDQGSLAVVGAVQSATEGLLARLD